jgi:hypothetical protein
MNALFGPERANALRLALKGKMPDMREALILEAMSQALKEMGGQFVLPFLFKSPTGVRTSHSLVFVTKHFKGYEIMKDIMAKESSSAEQGSHHLPIRPRTPRHRSCSDSCVHWMTCEETYSRNFLARHFALKRFTNATAWIRIS